MDWQLLKTIGYKVYKCEDWRDYKRYYVFLIRCWLHRTAMDQHLKFFNASPTRNALCLGCPWLIDQATRQVFYKGSAFDERVQFIQYHILHLEALFNKNLLHTLYVKGERILLWRDTFEDKPLSLYLVFWNGQQKEGCLSLDLVYDSTDLQHVSWDYGSHIYQIMFALGSTPPSSATNSTKEQKPVIRIGALQGLAGGSELIKKLTKHYFGYRPKNLILWCLRCFAVTIGAAGMTAVSNSGYYAMNHIRLDRKLKVDLNRFWEETGGTPVDGDSRFYNIPIDEYRKAMSEMKPSKRANHRRRYELMDSIQETITTSLAAYMLTPPALPQKPSPDDNTKSSRRR